MLQTFIFSKIQIIIIFQIIVVVTLARKTAVLIPTFVAIIVIGILGLLFIPDEVKNKSIDFKKGTVKIDNSVITVEIAESDAEQQRWLMFRTEKIPFDSAMILVYKNLDLYSLWLLNIEYPLDLMWFDENGKLVYMKKNANPCLSTFDIQNCTYKTTKPAKYIIAATSGFIDTHKFNENSTMTIISI